MTDRSFFADRIVIGPAALLASLTCLLVVAGCGTRLGSQSGSPADASPQAVATPVGNAPTTSNGAVVITVRSGSDVVLSGKDSVAGNSPLTSFAWTQDASDAHQVNIIYRTANTASFTAPTVAAPSQLKLTLTVADAKSRSSTARVLVNVQPASDPDQFLTAPVTNATPRTFQVAVVPQSSLRLTVDAPLCISLVRTINYTARGKGGVPAAATPVQLPATRIDTSWLAASGGLGVTEAGGLGNAVASYTNPRASFAVPIFNDEDLFVRFNQPQGPDRPPAVESSDTTAARIAQQLVPADVDTGSLSLTITAAPGTCTNPDSTAAGGTALVVSLLQADGTPVNKGWSDPAVSPNLTFSADELHAYLKSSTYVFPETADTATSYYKAIDPIGSAPHAQQTLNNWLDANCFNHSAANYGADTHAVYTNNFDLGFGRDMYFVTCTLSNRSAGRQAGDSASVVINYPSLEATVQKQNPIIAVAMSHNAYSSSGTASERFTKFFTFAPDDRDGNFYLVRSANFDHRGQRYLPGACTVCHGGTVSAATLAGGPTSVAGDLNAAFMPWDESSLLFSDTDPAYSGLLVPKTGYTKAEQAPSIYALNQHAYATYLTADPTKADRYAAPKALIEKWYGGLAGSAPAPGTLYGNIKFKNQTFSDADFPTDLQIDSAGNPISGTSWNDENTANKDDLYHTVFAHGCRACHAQLYKTADLTGGDRFSSYGSFAKLFAAAANGSNAANGGKSMEELVFKLSEMPLARLTADRFWVDFAGGMSAATRLAVHGANILNVSGLAASNQAIPPGAPIVNAFAGTTTLADGVATSEPRLSQVRADSSTSFFVDDYKWSLCLIPSPAPGSANALPSPTDPCNPLSTLVSAPGPVPAFGTAPAGIYRLTLMAGNAQGFAAAKQTYQFNVNRTDPVAPNCQFQVLTGQAPGQVTSLVLSASSQCPGGYRDGDGTTTLSIDTAATTYPPAKVCVNGSTAAWAGGTCPPVTNGRAISVDLLTGDPAGSVKYALCDSADNYCAKGTINIKPVTTPTTPGGMYEAHLPLLAPLGTAAQNGSAATLMTMSDGSLTVAADAVVVAGACPGVPDSNSFAQFYHVVPCTDGFTLAFTPSLNGAPTGTLHLGGNETIKLSPASAKPVCSYTGTNSCTVAAPSLSVGFTVTDTTSGLSSLPPPGTVKLFIEQTQSFSDAAIPAGNTTIPHRSIASYLQAGCAGGSCHTSGNAAWNFGAQASDMLMSLQSQSPPPNCDSAAVADTTGGSHGSKCIEPPATSANSAVYLNACVLDHRTATFVGNNMPFNQSAATGAQWCANLLQWLTEGAQPN